MAVRLANSSAIVAADALVDLLDTGGAGSLEIRTGSQPTNGDDADSGTVLGTFTLSATAFGGAADADPHADAVANTIADVTAAATGTAGYYAAKDGAGTTRWTGTITATGGGGDLTLASTSITSGQTLSITSWTFRHLEQ